MTDIRPNANGSVPVFEYGVLEETMEYRLLGASGLEVK